MNSHFLYYDKLTENAGALVTLSLRRESSACIRKCLVTAESQFHGESQMRLQRTPARCSTFLEDFHWSWSATGSGGTCERAWSPGHRRHWTPLHFMQSTLLSPSGDNALILCIRSLYPFLSVNVSARP